MIRSGVMLAGSTGSGKTTCYKVLQKTLSITQIQKTIKTKCLNPKSVSIDELYGYEDFESKEWRDGLISKILRKFVTAQDDRIYWIVFDGPVDVLWIENINSALDNT